MESPPFSGNFVNLPLEITFENNFFFVSKCNPIGTNSFVDVECNNS